MAVVGMRRLVITLDDYSPRPGTNDLSWCNKLIEKYPDIKFNLFTPVAFCRLGENPYYISNHPEWIGAVKNLPESNYRINFHGVFHRRTGSKHPESNNDEFQFLNTNETKGKIYKMKTEFKKSGIKVCKTFRPPAWKISASAARVLTDDGFVIAGDNKYYQKLKDSVSGMKWVSWNWDMIGPPPNDNDVVIFSHSSSWTNNYFDKKVYSKILELLDDNKFEFKFIEEL